MGSRGDGGSSSPESLPESGDDMHIDHAVSSSVVGTRLVHTISSGDEDVAPRKTAGRKRRIVDDEDDHEDAADVADSTPAQSTSAIRSPFFSAPLAAVSASPPASSQPKTLTRLERASDMEDDDDIVEESKQPLSPAIDDDDDDEDELPRRSRSTRSRKIVDEEVDYSDEVKESPVKRSRAAVEKTIFTQAYGRSTGQASGADKRHRGAALVAKSLTSTLATSSDPLVSTDHLANLTSTKRTDKITMPAQSSSDDEEEAPTKRGRATMAAISKKISERNAAQSEKEKKRKRKFSRHSSEDDDDDQEEEEEEPDWNSDQPEEDDEEAEEEQEEDEESAASEEEADTKRRSTRTSTRTRKPTVVDDDSDEYESAPAPRRGLASKPTAAPASKPAASIGSFFSKSTSDRFSYADEQKAALAALKAKQRAERKAEDDISEIASSDMDQSEAEQPTRASGRPSRACNARKPAPTPTPVPAAPVGRRSGRTHAAVSYREPTDNEGLDERTPTPPPTKRRNNKKTIVVDEDDEDEPASDEDLDQSFFDDGDTPVDAAAQAHFNSRFAAASTKSGAARKSKKVAVTTTKKKSKKKSKSRRGSDDDDDSSSSDSAAERREERRWTKEQGLMFSDASDSVSGSDSDVEENENPVEKILAKRQVRIPSDPTDPKSLPIHRTEFFCKYRDLSYHHCDWIDRKTIERWRNGKGRISLWHKNEAKPDSNISCYVNDRKLFQQIREMEIVVFNRDEAEGTNQLIANETSRVNKRLHPDMKTIEKVWAPLIFTDHSADGADADDDAELAAASARPMLFDPSFLEVERIIGERDEENHAGVLKKQYLIKWVNQPYADVTWEDADTAEGEFIFEEHVTRFRRSLAFPTKHQLDVSRAYTQSDIRPKPDVYSATNPCPPFRDGKELRDYQLAGVNWMTINFFRKQNGILADEMGLGKTIQSVAFLRTLFTKGLRGPFLVLAPLSCTPHWQREFETWTDEMSVVRYSDNQLSRDMVVTYELQWKSAMGCATPVELAKMKSREMKDVIRPNVIIASYDTFRHDLDFFQRVQWQCLIVDEAHLIRNEQSKMYQGLKTCDFSHIMLLTGTPIQNNLGELFTLLSFIDPDRFNDRAEFDAKYAHLQKSGEAEDVTSLQKVIQPYFYRRMKGDVEKTLPKREETLIEVEMTSLQKQYYRAVFEQNIDFLRGSDSKTKSNLMNVAMQLRLTCNHPFLVKGVEDKVIADMQLDTDDAQMEQVLALSGKMILLDKLLTKLHSQGSKVLIFSQFVKVLDLVEDFLNWRRWTYERLDGSTAARNRQVSIDRFSKPGSDRFVFMLSTKAGGMGINLTAADTVIIFDSDWNPQGDVQAMARAHRIGQKKTVQVYRLICANTYESELFERASMKLGLDQAVLHTMQKDQVAKNLDKKEIEGLLRRGAAWMLKEDDSKAVNFCAADIDTILEKNTRQINSEATLGAASARSGLGSFTLATFNTAKVGDVDIAFDDPDFWAKVAKNGNMEAAAKKHSEKKRAHKQMYDLHQPGGRAAALDNADWTGVVGDSDLSDAYDSDTFELKKSRKKRGAAAVAAGDDVEYSEPDDDEAEQFYSGAFSKRQSVRFLHALQTYGYNRLDELKPYFPNQTLRDMQRLAIGFICRLNQRAGKKPSTASVLFGTIRQDLLALLKSDLAEKATNDAVDAATDSSPSKSAAATAAARLEHKSWSDLFDLFPIEPTLTDPKLEKSSMMVQSKRVLGELNRLAVLHCQVKAAEAKQGDEQKAATVPPPPSPDSVDTTKYVQLPQTLRSLSLPSIDSAKDALPAEWWVPEIHDPALLLGIYALGFQHSASAAPKTHTAWERLKLVPGLAFFEMAFGKRKPGKRSTKKNAEDDAEGRIADDVDENSRSSEQSEANTPAKTSTDTADAIHIDTSDAAPTASSTNAAASTTEAAAATDVSEAAAAVTAPPAGATPIDLTDSVTPPVTDAVPAPFPVLADASPSAAATAAAAAVDPIDPVGEPEQDLPVWATAQKLKARVMRLLDSVERSLKSSMPSVSDYKVKPNRLNTMLAVTSTKSTTKSAANDENASKARPEAVHVAPVWKQSHVRAVIKALSHHGQPRMQTLHLPAEYFDETTPLQTVVTVKTDVKDEPIAASTSDEPMMIDDGIKAESVKAESSDSVDRSLAAVTAVSANPPQTHAVVDDYTRFLHHCSLRLSSVRAADIESLVHSIVVLARITSKLPSEPKKDDAAKKKKGDPESLDALLAAELTNKKARNLLEKMTLAEEVAKVLLQCGANLHEHLANTSFKPVPFPSFELRVDDAALLIGAFKHGLNCWNAMREDPRLTIFKKLEAKPVASAEGDAAEKDQKAPSHTVDGDVTMTADDLDASAAKEEDVKESVKDESKEDAKSDEKKSDKARYDYHESKMIERIKQLVGFLKSRTPSSTSSASGALSSPKKSSAPSAASAKSKSSSTSSPTKKARQPTLGADFGVALDFVPDAKAALKTAHFTKADLNKGAFGSKKKESPGAAASLKGHHQSSPQKPPAKKAKVDSVKSSPSKPTPSPRKPPPTSLIDDDIEEIEDFLDSPPAGSPSKKARARSPIRAPQPQAHARAKSPAPITMSSSIAALSADAVDSPFSSLTTPSPPTTKKQKMADGSATSTATTAATKTKVVEKAKSAPSAAAKLASSTKAKSSSSSTKKKPMPTAGTTSIASFFALKSPAPKLTISNTAEKKAPEEVIDLE